MAIPRRALLVSRIQMANIPYFTLRAGMFSIFTLAWIKSTFEVTRSTGTAQPHAIIASISHRWSAFSASGVRFRSSCLNDHPFNVSGTIWRGGYAQNPKTERFVIFVAVSAVTGQNNRGLPFCSSRSSQNVTIIPICKVPVAKHQSDIFLR